MQTCKFYTDYLLSHDRVPRHMVLTGWRSSCWKFLFCAQAGGNTAASRMLLRWQNALDALLTVAHMHLDAVAGVDVFGQMLRRVYAAVLAAGASEGEHQAGEAALDVAAHVGIGQLVDAVEEGEYLPVVLEEADDGLVEAGQLLVRLVPSGVVGGAAVEHVAAAVARLVGRDALAV